MEYTNDELIELIVDRECVAIVEGRQKEANKYRAIAQRLRETEWVSVEDRLPEPDSHVLIMSEGKHYAARVYKDERFIFLDDWGNYCELLIGEDVSYWMPLPKSSTKQSEEG